MNSLGQVKERVKITDRFESILNKFVTPFKFGIWICACFCNVLACVLAILLFIELLHIWILLFFFFFFINLRMRELIDRARLNEYMKRADSGNRAGSLFKNKPARQNEPAPFQLPLRNSEAISTELTTDCRVGLKMMQNSVLRYKRASSPHVITLEQLNCFFFRKLN